MSEVCAMGRAMAVLDEDADMLDEDAQLPMNVSVSLVSGRSVAVTVTGSETVRDFRDTVAELLDVPVGRLTLVAGTSRMAANECLATYVPAETRITAVVGDQNVQRMSIPPRTDTRGRRYAMCA